MRRDPININKQIKQYLELLFLGSFLLIILAFLANTTWIKGAEIPLEYYEISSAQAKALDDMANPSLELNAAEIGQ